jgi:cytochrome c-type biogenesis protein CcmF
LGIREIYALMSFGLSLFVLMTILSEFWKGARAIAGRTGQNLIAATVELTHRNTRRYGGYLVHVGIVMMFIGFTGAVFNHDATREVLPGDRFDLGRYQLSVRELPEGENDNIAWHKAIVEVRQNGELVKTLEPVREFYKTNRQSVGQVSIWRRLNEDLYLSFAGMADDNSGRAIIQAYVFPLVTWIWIGFWVVFVGTLVCLVPSKVKLAYPRTEVLGAVGKQPARSSTAR